jgi:phenylpyruvate tautomerase PptA (4-oxalocrotonate tautomerase family)
MPILDIEIVVRPNEFLLSDLAARLAEAAGKVLQAPKGGTWVKLRALQPTEYAEDGGQPEDVSPVFVRVLRAELPARAELEQEMTQLTEAIGQACGRPAENVHVFYEPAGRGRVSFGGKSLT